MWEIARFVDGHVRMFVIPPNLGIVNVSFLLVSRSVVWECGKSWCETSVFFQTLFSWQQRKDTYYQLKAHVHLELSDEILSTALLLASDLCCSRKSIFFFFFLHDRALRLEIHVLFTWPCCEPLRGWSRGNILSASLFEDGSRKGMWEFSFCRPARGWLCEIFYRNSRSVVWEFADYHVKILDNVKMIEKNSKMARKKSSARVSLSRFNPSIFVGIRLFL